MDPQRSDRSLPEETLRWVVDAVDPSAEVAEVRRLTGGVSSLVHKVTLRKNGVDSEVVLRRFHDDEWLSHEPDLVRHEAHSLNLAAQTELPTPALLAYDETGTACGLPAVLMTCLQGSMELNPSLSDVWTNQLAAALAQIHTVNADSFPWRYFTYKDLSKLEIPAWTRIPDIWKKVNEVLTGPRPTYTPCFIHRDYHPTNVLWHQGKMSGIVDWVNACRGPAGIDLGHCRVNLAQLYGVEAADAFKAAYEYHAGSAFQYDPFWDLVSINDILFGPPEVYPGWTDLGYTGLTDELVAQRIEQYTESVLRRF